MQATSGDHIWTIPLPEARRDLAFRESNLFSLKPALASGNPQRGGTAVLLVSSPLRVSSYRFITVLMVFPGRLIQTVRAGDLQTAEMKAAVPLT